MIREFVPCTSCKGSGTVTRSIITDYHRGEYDLWYENCTSCDGVGILVKITVFEKYIKPKIGKE